MLLSFSDHLSRNSHIIMSLEAMFATLSLGDAASIVEKIKADGIVKSGFVEGLEALKAKAGSSDQEEAKAGLTTVKAIAEGCTEADAINKECLTQCKFLHCSGSGPIVTGKNFG